MTTHKRTQGDYVITTIDPQDYTRINTHTVEINGNLNVRGNLTYIEVTELRVDDPFITVAANNSGAGNSAAFPNQGVVAQTGTGTFAGLRFHNDTGEWQISSSVDADGDPISAYQPIGVATSGQPGGPISAIQYNLGLGVFGGDVGFSRDLANSTVVLQGYLALSDTGSVPSVMANTVTLYNAAVGGGDTGVYVRSATVNDELVSRSAAIVYSIIF